MTIEIGFATREDCPGIKGIVNSCLTEIVAKDCDPKVVEAIRSFYNGLDYLDHFDLVLCAKDGERVVGSSALTGDFCKLFYFEPSYPGIKELANDLFQRTKMEALRLGNEVLRVYALNSSRNFCKYTQKGTEKGKMVNRIGSVSFEVTEFEWKL